jgi:hypothetical protein
MYILTHKYEDKRYLVKVLVFITVVKGKTTFSIRIQVLVSYGMENTVLDEANFAR